MKSLDEIRERTQYRLKHNLIPERYPVENPVTPPTGLSLNCVYRGEQIDSRTCYTCGRKGSVEIPIFACKIHGRCALTKSYSDAECCQHCTERIPSLSVS